MQCVNGRKSSLFMFCQKKQAMSKSILNAGVRRLWIEKPIRFLTEANDSLARMIDGALKHSR